MGVEGLSFRTEEVQGLKHPSCLDVSGACVASKCGFGAFGGSGFRASAKQSSVSFLFGCTQSTFF